MILNKIISEIKGSIGFLIEKYSFITAKREANRRHFLDGKTYWVIKLRYRYRVFSSSDIKDFKQRGFFRKDLDHVKLSKIAAYSTTEKNIR